MSMLELVFPRPGSGQASGTREALLLAAEDLLRSREIETLGIRTVARRAHSSVGSFYDYFPTKRALLDQLLLRFFTTRNSFLARRIDSDRWAGIDLRTRVTAMIDVAVDYNRAYPAFNRALLRHRLAASEEIAEPLSRMEADGQARWIAFLASSAEVEAGDASYDAVDMAVSTMGRLIDSVTLVPAAGRIGIDGSSAASFRERLRHHVMLTLTPVRARRDAGGRGGS